MTLNLKSFVLFLAQRKKFQDTGVQVYDCEYAFGGHEFAISGIFKSTPLQPPLRVRHIKKIFVGETNLDENQVLGIVENMGTQYLGCRYHILERNCNHFSKELTLSLTKKTKFPKWINRSANFAHIMRCVIPDTFIPPTTERNEEIPNFGQNGKGVQKYYDGLKRQQQKTLEYIVQEGYITAQEVDHFVIPMPQIVPSKSQQSMLSEITTHITQSFFKPNIIDQENQRTKGLKIGYEPDSNCNHDKAEYSNHSQSTISLDNNNSHQMMSQNYRFQDLFGDNQKALYNHGFIDHVSKDRNHTTVTLPEIEQTQSSCLYTSINENKTLTINNQSEIIYDTQIQNTANESLDFQKYGQVSVPMSQEQMSEGSQHNPRKLNHENGPITLNQQQSKDNILYNDSQLQNNNVKDLTDQSGDNTANAQKFQEANESPKLRSNLNQNAKSPQTYQNESSQRQIANASSDKISQQEFLANENGGATKNTKKEKDLLTSMVEIEMKSQGMSKTPDHSQSSKSKSVSYLGMEKIPKPGHKKGSKRNQQKQAQRSFTNSHIGQELRELQQRNQLLRINSKSYNKNQTLNGTDHIGGSSYLQNEQSKILPQSYQQKRQHAINGISGSIPGTSDYNIVSSDPDIDNFSKNLSKKNYLSKDRTSDNVKSSYYDTFEGRVQNVERCTSLDSQYTQQTQKKVGRKDQLLRRTQSMTRQKLSKSQILNRIFFMEQKMALKNSQVTEPSEATLSFQNDSYCNTYDIPDFDFNNFVTSKNDVNTKQQITHDGIVRKRDLKTLNTQDLMHTNMTSVCDRVDCDRLIVPQMSAQTQLNLAKTSNNEQSKGSYTSPKNIQTPKTPHVDTVEQIFENNFQLMNRSTEKRQLNQLAQEIKENSISQKGSSYKPSKEDETSQEVNNYLRETNNHRKPKSRNQQQDGFSSRTPSQTKTLSNSTQSRAYSTTKDNRRANAAHGISKEFSKEISDSQVMPNNTKISRGSKNSRTVQKQGSDQLTNMTGKEKPYKGESTRLQQLQKQQQRYLEEQRRAQKDIMFKRDYRAIQNQYDVQGSQSNVQKIEEYNQSLTTTELMLEQITESGSYCQNDPNQNNKFYQQLIQEHQAFLQAQNDVNQSNESLTKVSKMNALQQYVSNMNVLRKQGHPLSDDTSSFTQYYFDNLKQLRERMDNIDNQKSIIEQHNLNTPFNLNSAGPSKSSRKILMDQQRSQQVNSVNQKTNNDIQHDTQKSNPSSRSKTNQSNKHNDNKNNEYEDALRELQLRKFEQLGLESNSSNPQQSQVNRNSNINKTPNPKLQQQQGQIKIFNKIGIEKFGKLRPSRQIVA